jgi:DNA-directed RNA polymerase specialized sigma24 family protein
MSKKQKTKKTKSAKPTNHQANDLEMIAKKMDEISRRRLPDGVIRHGILQGMESEIRQHALIMSVGGFLQENADYLDARRKHDEAAIRSSMERCMAVALSIAKRRLASRHAYELARTTKLTEGNGGVQQHPSDTRPCDWTPDTKAVMVMRSVARAVHQGKLSISNASIVSMICVRGLAAEEVAVAVGITRSAVYQRIWRVKRVLPEVMSQVEVPLL